MRDIYKMYNIQAMTETGKKYVRVDENKKCKITTVANESEMFATKREATALANKLNKHIGKKLFMVRG